MMRWRLRRDKAESRLKDVTEEVARLGAAVGRCEGEFDPVVAVDAAIVQLFRAAGSIPAEELARRRRLLEEQLQRLSSPAHFRRSFGVAVGLLAVVVGVALAVRGAPSPAIWAALILASIMLGLVATYARHWVAEIMLRRRIRALEERELKEAAFREWAEAQRAYLLGLFSLYRDAARRPGRPGLQAAA